jgi:hypothetical protein
MRSALIFAILLSFQIISSQALTSAQLPPPQMERPIWTLGSRWVQNIKRQRQGLRGREVQTLVKIDTFEGAQAYFLRFEVEWTDAQGRKRTERYTKLRDFDLTPIVILDEKGNVVFRRKIGWLRWPLVVGESWNADGENQFLDRTGWITERVSEQVFIKGVEETTTPAGTFAAFHVGNVRRVFDNLGRPLRHEVEDDWISPEPRIWVRYTGTDEDGELVEYDLK